MAPTSNENTQHLALLSVCDTIRALLAGAERDEVMTRHRVGLTLLEIREGAEKYGDRSIERAAAHIGASARVLYEYVAVAQHWTASDIAAQLENTNSLGRPLTWSHFVTLGRVNDPKARQRLVQECIENAWSVRDLRKKMQNDSAEPARNSDAAREGEAAHAAMREGLQRGGRWMAELQLFDEAIESRLFDPDEAVDEDELERVIDLYGNLQHRTATTLNRLREVRKSRTRLRVAGTEPGSEWLDEEDVPADTVMVSQRRARPTR